MKFTPTLIASLSALSAAAPAHNNPKPISTFTGIALRSASPIHFLPLTAHHGAIWLGGKTKSYCPHSVVQDCPKGKETAFERSTKSNSGYSLVMDAEVPGGQRVYIDKDGRVRYTQAHSGVMPQGAHVSGWGVDAQSSKTAFVSHKGLVACPTDGSEWAVYVTRPGWAGLDHCLGFDIDAQKFKGYAAWEYE